MPVRLAAEGQGILVTKRNAPSREVSGYGEAASLNFAPGLFWFIRHDADPQPIGLFHTCPCGCEALGSLYFKGRRPKTWGPGAEWDVAGEWPLVSLTPSIGFKGGHDSAKGADGYHWHGYLTNGVFTEC